jgi:hypothetical protein
MKDSSVIASVLSVCYSLHPALFRLVIFLDYEVSAEIRARIASGNRCFHAFIKLLKTSTLPRKIKLNVYRDIIRPVVLYWCETYTPHRVWREPALSVGEEGPLQDFWRCLSVTVSSSANWGNGNAVTLICAAPFSNMYWTQADKNSRKLRLRCGCQFHWCAHALRLFPGVS